MKYNKMATLNALWNELRNTELSLTNIEKINGTVLAVQFTIVNNYNTRCKYFPKVSYLAIFLLFIYFHHNGYREIENRYVYKTIIERSVFRLFSFHCLFPWPQIYDLEEIPQWGAIYISLL